MILAELTSAARGHRSPRSSPLDLVALLALADWDAASQLLHHNPGLVEPSGGALHLMAKRNDAAAVRWLVDHGAEPSARWAHWDSDVTPLHLAVLAGHSEIVRILLAAGADPTIRDTKHDSDAIGWAEHFQQADVARILRLRAEGRLQATGYRLSSVGVTLGI